MNDLKALVSKLEDASERNNLISQSAYYVLDDLEISLRSEERRFKISSLNIQGFHTLECRVHIQEFGKNENTDITQFKLKDLN